MENMNRFAQVLDPWNDFGLLERKLNTKDACTIVALGASWCHKCEPLHDSFFKLPKNSSDDITLLWLDLEDHCEFLGEFFPETLPLVWVYQGHQLTRYGTPAIPEPTDSMKQTAADFIQAVPIMTSAPKPEVDLRRFLLQENWAV